jgi:NAD(P)H-nitrite reductase large subunit
MGAKICPGIIFCEKGQQDSVGVGLKRNEKYHDMALPWKYKICVSGCGNSCAGPVVKGRELIGTSKGLRILLGGSSGLKFRIGQVQAENLSDDAAMNPGEGHQLSLLNSFSKRP